MPCNPPVYCRRVIDLEATDAVVFIDLALDQMMSKAVALGPRVSDRPHVEGANSVFSLVVHSLGAADWWLDHVVLGHPSSRDRAAEFKSSGSVSDLELRVAAFRAAIPNIMDQVVRTPEPQSGHLQAETASFRKGSWTNGSILLHVIAELFQHAGHVDITADLLSSDFQLGEQ